MSKLIVDTVELRNDAKQFRDWARDLTALWNAAESDLAPHTQQSYFGQAVPGITRFYGEYVKARDALRHYLADTGEGSGAYALGYFATELKDKAAVAYDTAVRDIQQNQLSALPES